MIPFRNGYGNVAPEPLSVTVGSVVPGWERYAYAATALIAMTIARIAPIMVYLVLIFFILVFVYHKTPICYIVNLHKLYSLYRYN